MFSDKNNPFLKTWQNLLQKNAQKTAILSSENHPLRTFQEIENASSLLASTWQKEKLTGRLLSLQLSNSPTYPEVLLAVWKISAGALLLPPDMQENEVQEIEKRTSTTARISNAQQNNTPNLKKISTSKKNTTPPPDLIKVTSGTTSQPRLVCMSAQQLFADGQNIIQGMGISPDDIQYGLIPWSHSYGFSSLLAPLFIQGTPLVCTHDAIPRAIWNGIKKTSSSIFPGVPAHFHALATLPPPCPASLRLCISAGAPLSSTTANAFFKNTGRLIHSFYGSSECGGICYDPIGHPALTHDAYIGQALPNVNLQTNPAAENAENEIKLSIQSPAVSSGYWPLSSKKIDPKLQNGIFRPDDILEKLPTGYRLIGRDSDLINIGGKKISPLQIEKQLLGCTGVSQALVVGGVPKQKDREQIYALIVLAPGTPPCTHLKQQILAELTDRLPAWCLPREITFSKNLPINPRGKINRRQIFQKFFYDTP
ncbi:MAG: class I adenylate-forming enzyme family protein [Chthoniobacterales bacterium]